jgi:hypothetical protein
MSDERPPKDDPPALPKRAAGAAYSRWSGEPSSGELSSRKQALGAAERDWSVDPETVRELVERLQSEGFGMEEVQWVDQLPKQQGQGAQKQQEQPAAEQQAPEQAAPEEGYDAGY